MTESEAKQKWCPMFNGWIHHTENVGHYKCKGSECMMWRITVAAGSTELQQTAPNTYNKVEIPAQGYCGLAGKP